MVPKNRQWRAPLQTWGELEAQGIKRCRAIFKDGKRCRRRASAQFDCSWCEKHGPVIALLTDMSNAVE